MRSQNAMGSVARLACMILVAVAAWLGGCNGDSTEPSGGPAGGNDGEPQAAQQVAYVEIDETNTDTFAAPFALFDAGTERLPFLRVGEAIEIDAAVANETDAEALAARGVVLGDPAVPLSRCTVLVRHRIGFAGAGRTGERVAFYGFASLPAEIELPARPTEDRFEYDPADSSIPFVVAMQEIRIFLPEGSKLTLEAGEGEKLTLQLGESHLQIAAGENGDLAEGTATVAVVELALTKDKVRYLGGDPPADLPEVLRPRRDHGRVKFTTSLSAKYAGRLTARVVEGLGSEELE